MTNVRTAAFLDRDGTVIEDADYLADPDGLRLIPGTVEALHRLRDAGHALVVVTNQSGIARGLYSEEDYHAVAARLDEVLSGSGLALDRTYYCAHHPEHSGPCDCRKPALGLYEAAARDLGLDLAACWYVGDKVTDVLPAAALGGRGVLVRTGYGREHEDGVPAGVEVVADLSAAADLIVATGSLSVDPKNGLG
jgi:D-glycero-D-manno-heptose 1,7-bisphosphate phosphatase